MRATVEALLGIVLPVGLHSWALVSLRAPGGAGDHLRALNPHPLANARDQLGLQLRFIRDEPPTPRGLLVAWLAAWLGWVVFRARQKLHPA